MQSRIWQCRLYKSGKKKTVGKCPHLINKSLMNDSWQATCQRVLLISSGLRSMSGFQDFFSCTVEAASPPDTISAHRNFYASGDNPKCS